MACRPGECLNTESGAGSDRRAQVLPKHVPEEAGLAWKAAIRQEELPRGGGWSRDGQPPARPCGGPDLCVCVCVWGGVEAAWLGLQEKRWEARWGPCRGHTDPGEKSKTLERRDREEPR